MKKVNKILMISHTYVKKINLSLPVTLSQNKNLEVVCVVPKKISQGDRFIYPDYKKRDIKIKLIQSELINKSMRSQYFEKIKEIIKEQKPNTVILDNDTVCFQSMILIYWSFFFKYKIYYFCNENNLINILSKFSFKKLIKFLVIFFINLIIKFRVGKIFCYSIQIKKNYDFFGYKKKTIIIPLGFDKKVFFIKKKKKKIKNLTISYFGRITPEKGIHVLVDALKIIKNYDWNLIIDIDHIEDKKYFLKIKRELKNNFLIKRYKYIKCDHYQIAQYMRLSDVIVLPSLHEEQYGRVIQEGIACGNVAVGSKIGAIPELIKDKQLLFDPGKSKNLALILKRLFNNRYYLKKLNFQKTDINKNRSIQSQANLILRYL